MTGKHYLLMNELNIQEFDLITCYEHLEHIPENRLRQFIGNMDYHSHIGTIFHCSIADYSDDEKIHCTVLNESTWINMFALWGWKPMLNKILTKENYSPRFEKSIELTFIKEQ